MKSSTLKTRSRGRRRRRLCALEVGHLPGLMKPSHTVLLQLRRLMITRALALPLAPFFPLSKPINSHSASGSRAALAPISGRETRLAARFAPDAPLDPPRCRPPRATSGPTTRTGRSRHRRSRTRRSRSRARSTSRAIAVLRHGYVARTRSVGRGRPLLLSGRRRSRSCPDGNVYMRTADAGARRPPDRTAQPTSTCTPREGDRVTPPRDD